jgi:hypothetical protein
MPPLSDASAVIEMVPDTVAPPRGAVSLTVGRLGSAGSATVVNDTESWLPAISE